MEKKHLHLVGNQKLKIKNGTVYYKKQAIQNNKNMQGTVQKVIQKTLLTESKNNPIVAFDLMLRYQKRDSQAPFSISGNKWYMNATTVSADFSFSRPLIAGEASLEALSGLTM